MIDTKINIWDLGEKINVRVRTNFLDFINHKIRTDFGTKRKIHEIIQKEYPLPFTVFKDRIKNSYRYFVDLEIFLSLCKILQISWDKLQENIVAYKSRKGVNYIESPILPIILSPIFDMLIAHHIGDGNVIDPLKGRKPYFSYRQFNSLYRNLYIQKIESLFGRLVYKNNYFDNESTTRIYFPTVVSSALFQAYDLNTKSFLSETARIPEKIFHKNWKHQLAFLLGIIIDEGNIDSDLILIRMKNEMLVKDLQKICSNLQYESTFKKGKNGMFCLYIPSKSLPNLYQDYLLLLKEYPEVNLGIKEVRIKLFINRLSKPKLYLPGNKEEILQELQVGALTVSQVAEKLNMTRQGARYLLSELKKENKIKLTYSNHINHKYMVGKKC